MQPVVLVATTLATISQAVVRTYDQRVVVGECASQADKNSQLFPVSYLQSYSSVGSTQMAAIDAPITAANNIDIKYATSFKVVTENYAKEQYVLVQCGADQPSAASINAVKALPAGFTRKFFTIPLQQVIVQSTVQLGFLEVLGLQDRVSHATSFAVGSCWQKANGCGAAAETSNATIIAQQRAPADAVFMDCPWSNGPNCAALASIPKAIHFSASQEPAPLHSAEHIKFMAAFFNKEEAADTFFQATITTMQAFMQQSSTANKPVVAWIQLGWGGGSAQLNMPAFKKKITEMAGATMVNATAVKNTMGNQMSSTYSTSDKAGFLTALASNGVTAIIDETYSSNVASYDLAKFLTNFDIQASSSLSFVQNQMIFREDSGYSGTSNLDWFEARLVYPHRTIQGLQRVLFSDTTKPTFLFRNIAKGETPVQITQAACTKTLPACVTSANPAALSMITTLGQVTSGASRVGSMVAFTFTVAVLVGLIR
jgi:hypothetical protein